MRVLYSCWYTLSQQVRTSATWCLSKLLHWGCENTWNHLINHRHIYIYRERESPQPLLDIWKHVLIRAPLSTTDENYIDGHMHESLTTMIMSFAYRRASSKRCCGIYYSHPTNVRIPTNVTHHFDKHHTPSVVSRCPNIENWKLVQSHTWPW